MFYKDNSFKNVNRKYSCFLFLLITVFVQGCGSCNQEKRVVTKQEKIDESIVEEKKVSIVFKRLDLDLFTKDPALVVNEIPALQKKYGEFLNLFSHRIINIGLPGSPSFKTYLLEFLKDPSMREISAEIKKQYPNTTKIEEDLNNAFSRFHILYPKKTVPEVVFYNSGFNYSMVGLDSTLGIGLDMYLGRDCKFYKLMQMPLYKINTLNKENLVPDAVKSWVSTEFEMKPATESLLSQIIQEGKYLYMCDVLLPETEDSLKIGYTAQQMQWTLLSEVSIWKFFVDKQLLFTTNYKEIVKYINEAPFTPNMPRESPGRLGVWLGWQIVRNYMKNNPKVTVQELMQEADAQKILNLSKYKPRATT